MRNIVRILPNGDQWKITYNSQYHSSHLLKSAAIERGRSLTKANKPSQLMIHKGDGTIETEYTYENDPFPPRG